MKKRIILERDGRANGEKSKKCCGEAYRWWIKISGFIGIVKEI